MLTYSGCGTKTVYVDRPVEVLAEVPCKVKEVHCGLKGSDAEVVVGLAKCVINLKEEAKVCQ